MTDYDYERDRTSKSLAEAIVQGDRDWTRAERLAEAQVHATLAVAAAVRGEEDVIVEESIETRIASLQARIAEQDEARTSLMARAFEMLRTTSSTARTDSDRSGTR